MTDITISRVADAELSIRLDVKNEENVRRAFHDYQAAIRTLRYLAQKGLSTDESDYASKKASLDNHLRRLELFHTELLSPLMSQIARRHDG